MIERSRRRISAARITSLAHDLLDASTLCAISTVTRGGRAYVNTAYFAWNPELDVVWLSEPRALHSRNLRANRSAAVAVFDSGQSWGKPDRGIQLFGSAREGDGSAERLYAERFPEYRPGEVSAYRVYRFRARRLKLFDERALGTGVFVTVRVGAKGRVAWERTEIYRAAE